MRPFTSALRRILGSVALETVPFFVAAILLVGVLAGAATSDASSGGRATERSPATSTSERWTEPTAVPNTVGVISMHTSAGNACSALPIKGTRYVVTAAHCLVEADQVLRPVSIHFHIGDTPLRNPVERYALHPSYFEDDWETYDVAVLVTTHTWPYGADRVGWSAVEYTSIHAYGIQSIGDLGVRLTPDDLERLSAERDAKHRPGCTTSSCDDFLPEPSTGVARCRLPVDAYAVDDDAGPTAKVVYADCGLVPGASGGPVLGIDRAGRRHLIGVVSSVFDHWRKNGFTSSIAIDAVLNGRGIAVEADAYLGFGENSPYPIVHTPLTVTDHGP